MATPDVFHLNCGTLCPFGARLIHGHGGLFSPGRMVCHCLLLVGDRGLVLVDTGLGTRELERPKERLGSAFVALTRPRGDPAEAARRQIERLGFSADDVSDIVVTHLDLDHAGGLPDFPRARVHVHATELDAAIARATRHDRFRYKSVQWEHGPLWQRHAEGGDRWFGFEGARELPGMNGDVLLVPLLGHSAGHCGVAVREGEGWLLHAGDAYFFHGEVDFRAPRSTLGLSLFQSLVEHERPRRLQNQARLRELAREQGDRVRLLCSHDAVEFDRDAAASAERLNALGARAGRASAKGATGKGANGNVLAEKALAGAPGAGSRRGDATPGAPSAS